MTTVAGLLEVARSQLGVQESPSGSNNVLYTRHYGMVGQPWCDLFVSWCFEQAGMKATEGVHAYTPEHFQSFLNRGRGFYGGAGAQPGDIMFYDFPGGPDRISHTGICEAARPDGYVVIEGNTDEAGGRTGGKVMRQVRRSYIVGYGRPEFDQGDELDMGAQEEIQRDIRLATGLIIGDAKNRQEDVKALIKRKAAKDKARDLALADALEAVAENVAQIPTAEKAKIHATVEQLRADDGDDDADEVIPVPSDDEIKAALAGD